MEGLAGHAHQILEAVVKDLSMPLKRDDQYEKSKGQAAQNSLGP